MISEIPLGDYGLMTVDEAAGVKGWAVRSIQNWIAAGLLPVVCAGTGRRGVYLLREKDVRAFSPPARGRPKLETALKRKPKKGRSKK